MPDQKVRFGLTLPNLGVIIGATTVQELLALTEKAEEAGWDSVWVGDSLLHTIARTIRASSWNIGWLLAHHRNALTI
jgi:alkanesulfonate monooxygenase SsuD/methylene tetrahydromethanopterin reductase-like flavin-dependent oxidoreductase (luciferase family)